LDSNNQISNNAVKINASYSLGVFSSNLTASSGSFATLAANGYFGSSSPLYRITNFTVTLSSGSIYAYFGHSAWSREEVFASASFSVGLASAVHPASSPSYFMLLYPGNKYSIDGPISTLRLESIREANEDYEYLQLFRSYIATYNSTYSGSKNASTLLATYYNQLFSNVSTACSAATFESVRESLLTVLGNMAVDLKTTVESL
jgi:hypothetical protein